MWCVAPLSTIHRSRWAAYKATPIDSLTSVMEAIVGTSTCELAAFLLPLWLPLELPLLPLGASASSFFRFMGAFPAELRVEEEDARQPSSLMARETMSSNLSCPGGPEANRIVWSAS